MDSHISDNLNFNSVEDLPVNDIKFQNEYDLAVEKYGLERGIRGSKTHHLDQHEYYRQCQIDKRILEQDIFNLSDEKENIDTPKRPLAKL